MAADSPTRDPAGVAPPALKPRVRRISLRQALWRLLLWSLMPLVIGLCWAVWDQWRGQRESAYQQLAVSAKTLVLAVDRDMAVHREKLVALAASPLLDAGDWKMLHDHAMGIVAAEAGSLIVVSHPSGALALNTGVPWGQPLPNVIVPPERQTIEWEGRRLPVGSRGLSQKVFETGKPAYSGLYYGITVKRPTVSVVIPVIRDGVVVYTMTMAFAPQSLASLIAAAEGITPRMRAAVIDRDSVVIANNATSFSRMGDHTVMINEPETPGADVGRGVTRDGVSVHVAVAKSEITGWSVRLASPDDDVLALARQATYYFAAMTAIAVLLGGFMASMLARRLAAPLRRLAFGAREVQDGKDVALPESRIEEIDALGQALSNAARIEMAHRQEAQARVEAEKREAAAQQMAQSLRVNEERLRRLIDNVHAFVAVLELDGTIVEANRTGLERAGLARRDVVGLPFWEAYWWSYDGAVQEQLRQSVARARAGESSHYTVQARFSATERVWIDLTIGPLTDETGRVTHLIPSGVDINDQMRTQAALRDADRQKDQFIATLAHELRNPLAPIRSSAQIIKLRKPDDPAIVRAQQTIERQATQMARMVDDLLDISRITFGRIELRRQQCDLAELLGHAVDSMRGAVEAAHHALELRLPDAPLPVDADPARVNQIVLNVLSNAIRFTPAGGRITVSASRDDDHACVSVTDTGVGIEPTMLERVFEMFVQERPSGLAGSSGLGIGLGLARKLAALHGGSLVGRSEGRGRGSEFVLRLPLRERVEAEPQSAEPPAASGPGQRVLVVDDNVDAAESLKALLELQGSHHVDMAFDGRSAITAFNAVKPAAVVLDIGLPDISGYDVARRIRACDGGDRALLIALTGWGQEADRGRAVDAGFDHHLTKPAEPQRLLDLIGEARVTEPGA